MGSTTVQAPQQPNIAQAATSTEQAQIDLAPQQYGAVSQYAPQYQDLANQLAQQSLFGTTSSPGELSLYQQAAPQLQSLQSQLNAQQAGANVSLVNQLGGQATAAFQNANPQLQQVQTGLTNLATSGANPVGGINATNWGSNYNQGVGNAIAQNQVGGMGSTVDQLNNTAQQQLALGGSVSPQQAATISGQILANYNQQGRANDPTAIAGLATGLDTYSQQLLQQREANAAGAGGLQQQAQQANLSGALAGQGLQFQGSATQAQQQLAAQQANQAAQQFNAQYQAGTLGQAGSLLAQTSVNPFSAILGQSGAIGTASGAQGQGGASSTLQGQQNAFNPFPMATSLYNNYTGQVANANQTNATTSAGLFGGGISAIGTLGGAAIGAKLFFVCIPEGEKVDTLNGPVEIQEIEPGDMVIGYDGSPVPVYQAHHYKENPDCPRFIALTFDNGETLVTCDKHRVNGIAMEKYQTGDSIAGKTIIKIMRRGGITKSYDLLTTDLGYRMSGVPVNSMIEEMAFLTAKLMEAV